MVLPPNQESRGTVREVVKGGNVDTSVVDVKVFLKFNRSLT